MLRINKLADYGTVVMVYLARRDEQLLNARDIAHHTRLSVPTVSKLLKRLTAAGLLNSVRGVAGGYRLQRSAALISVAEIDRPRSLLDSIDKLRVLIPARNIMLISLASSSSYCLLRGMTWV